MVREIRLKLSDLSSDDQVLSTEVEAADQSWRAANPGKTPIIQAHIRTREIVVTEYVAEAKATRMVVVTD